MAGMSDGMICDTLTVEKSISTATMLHGALCHAFRL
jgi:hypothetical protein